MIILLSPTKQMDFSRELKVSLSLGNPLFSREAFEINRLLGHSSPMEMAGLMKTSEKLAESTCSLVRSFGSDDCARGPALLSYSGTVFQHMDVPSLEEGEWRYASDHVRILSGMFGYLKPDDRIYPYRLEMKTPLTTSSGSGLYTFWKDKITESLVAENRPVLNLTSSEYGKAVDWKRLSNPILSIHFKEIKGSGFSTVGMYSKMARGKIAGRIIREGLTDWKALKDWNINGYRYNDELSKADKWIFSGNWRS